MTSTEFFRLLLGAGLLVAGFAFVTPNETERLWETVHGRIAIWCMSLASFVLVHLVFEKLVMHFTKDANWNPSTGVTSRLWMETAQSITNWVIAVSGVIIGVVVGLKGPGSGLPHLSRVAVVVLSIGIILAFVYIMMNAAAIQGEKDSEIQVNTGRQAVASFVFNLMFTSFIGGIVALAIVSATSF